MTGTTERERERATVGGGVKGGVQQLLASSASVGPAVKHRPDEGGRQTRRGRKINPWA